MQPAIRKATKALKALGVSLTFDNDNVVSVRFDEVKRTPTVEDLLVLQYLKFLRDVDFYGTPVDSAMLESIRGLPFLESLNLNCSKINDSAIQVISAIKTLRRLGLMDTAVTDVSVPFVAAQKDLTSLRIDGSLITSSGLKTILKQPIETLWLDGQQASRECMALLSRSSNLRDLSLVGAAITNTTVEPLCRSESLRSISLLRTAVTNEALRELVDTPSLEELSLHGSREITDEAFTVLKQMKSLKKVWLHDTSVTLSGLAAFEAEMVNIAIWPTAAWFQQQRGVLAPPPQLRP